MMFQSKSFQSHERYLDLFNALVNSMAINKPVASDELSLMPTLKKQSHDDHDPLGNHEEQEVPTKVFGEKHSNWFKEVNEKDSTDDAFEQSWLMRMKIQENSNFKKNCFRNSVELEYSLEQCYLAMTYKIDWENSEGNTFHNDLSKPLPLKGPLGRNTIPTIYFFNNDLECLKNV
ncbi:hypothetical protein Tco_1393661 [Tanacetum coccineum]